MPNPTPQLGGTSLVAAAAPYRWTTKGDINAFFGLMLDNVANMVLLVSLLEAGWGLPASFSLRYMIPGTALGVVVGDLAFTAMAFQLARRTGARGRDRDAAGARHAEHVRDGFFCAGASVSTWPRSAAWT